MTTNGGNPDTIVFMDFRLRGNDDMRNDILNKIGTVFNFQA
jgi:hypothetical protein